MPIPTSKIEWHDDYVQDERGAHKFKNGAPVNQKICGSVLGTIGRTPIVRLNKIAKEYGLKCELYAKCEFLSGGGTTKDRVALRMIELAEEAGQLKEGVTIIEPSTGNTGISTALAVAPKGYKLITVMPDDQDKNREKILKALGAEVVKADNNADPESPEGFVGKSYELAKQQENSIVLWPHRDCANPMAHYETTAAGILRVFGSNVDAVVVSLNSGGTVLGVSKRLKKEAPNCKIIAAKDLPEYSVDKLTTIPFEGSMDQTISIEKEVGQKTMAKLHHVEGILCGPKGGVVLAAAIQVAKTMNEGEKCVMILPDGITKFMETALSANNQKIDIPPPDGTVPTPDQAPEFEWQRVPLPWNGTRIAKKVICQSILEAIGNTPLIKLKRIPIKDGITAEVLVKCEYMNPGGSVKDRMALKMVEKAEKEGVLKPGMTIVESSAGNTGIGLALVAAVKGYKCVIVMTEKQSTEKEQILKSLGAYVVRTPPDLPYTDPMSPHAVVLRLQKTLPDAVHLDQYRNEANPLAHYEGTGIEMFEQCDETIDAIVIGAGTGGTLTGVARRVREDLPNCMIYGVDPVGSAIADGPKEAKPYLVEGIGQDFIPAVMKSNIIDGWITVKDQDAFTMARRLIKEEGLLVGGSAGANVWAALTVAKKLGADSRVVTILPDGIRNTLSRVVDDEWMKSHGFEV
ncbi:unnamed protein product [Bursaphelenchus xylophilus]|uniref:cystathionine beta-synthase n=1 Tax=Bursaphelenchus xylophilus TaxID=6326 RepID=A0A1I7S4V3_BURXY|nr:unnamed protein product [Bursaphelenchus xylophilus]CAG9117399.1 unnamed protein product [Bursaphelenchus xylophilus]